jgi:hypothetical protein
VKVESGVFLDSGLNFKVSQFCDLFLDLVLSWHVGDRRWLRRLGVLAFLGLSLLGTDFARLIVCRPCSNDGVETMSFLKEEHSALLRKC